MYEHLGRLSAEHESGGKGCGTISTGKDDPGGVSYGTYQFATATGSADKFVKRSKFAYFFDGLKAGTKEFSDVWRRLAQEQPKEFAIAQHDEIASNYYLPLCETVKENFNLDITRFPIAVQDVVWSVAVQHGHNTKLLNNAIRKMNMRGIDFRIPVNLVRAIYEERMRTDSMGTLVYFKKATKRNLSMRERLLNRFKSELDTTLKRLSGELEW